MTRREKCKHTPKDTIRISCEYGCGADVTGRCIRCGALICETRRQTGSCVPDNSRAIAKGLTPTMRRV